MNIVEAIEKVKNGSDSKFKTNGSSHVIEKFRDVDYIRIAGSIIPLEGWEEIKPPKQWSEKELMLFRLLPEWAKWIARDRDSDDVFVYADKPKIESIIFYKNEEDEQEEKILENELFDFLTITFEESPVYIGDLKGE